MTKKSFNVAVAGATGAVGREMISILEERKFPVGELRLLASEKSVGQRLGFCGKEIAVQLLKEDSFAGIDIALFSAGAGVSRRFSPIAAEAGAVVIDNSSAFRMEVDVPLVVPEVNPEATADFRARRIIANPNCSTIQMVVVLKPIHDVVGIRRVVVSTYQSTAGAGQKAMNELSQQVTALQHLIRPGGPLRGRLHLALPVEGATRAPTKVFPHQIAFNCIPQIDVFLDNGYTKEEMKMIEETRKIMGEPALPITATAVRVPVFCGHSESVNIELGRPLSVAEARRILSKAPGVCVKDDPAHNEYPLAIESVGRDEVFVGRIRRDETVPHGLNLWIVADNLRKGAALNAVQIAEILKKYL